MANLITARKTYATVANAEKALAKVIATASEGLTLEDVRYFIAVSAEEHSCSRPRIFDCRTPPGPRAHLHRQVRA
jgi:hypothetical protein